MYLQFTLSNSLLSVLFIYRSNQTKYFKMTIKSIVIIISALTILPCLSSLDNQSEDCKQITSCSSCILKQYCVWCVTKSKCTKQECGNDNIIYPTNVVAIMAGPNFCPKVADIDVRTIKAGTSESIMVKITQIHLYMAFTPWKCKIVVNSEEKIVNAILLGDAVHCEATLFENKSDEPYVNGTVSVLWDYSKSFDGSLPIEVCRCDLDSKCKACK